MIEIWKTIKNFPRYEVSNLGNVKSLIRWWNPRILKATKKSTGYMQVCLGLGHVFYVHRLVLETFIGLCPDDYVGNHKDGIKHNNELSNLEWVSHGEDISHACRLGLRRMDGENHPRAKLTYEDVIQIKLRFLKGPYGIGIKLANEFDVSTSCISQIVNSRTYVNRRDAL